MTKLFSRNRALGCFGNASQDYRDRLLVQRGAFARRLCTDPFSDGRPRRVHGSAEMVVAGDIVPHRRGLAVGGAQEIARLRRSAEHRMIDGRFAPVGIRPVRGRTGSPRRLSTHEHLFERRRSPLLERRERPHDFTKRVREFYV